MATITGPARIDDKSPGGAGGRRTIWGSAWAVADQGVVSVCTFLLNLILARNLSAADFGVVVLMFGGYYVLQSVHRSFILYPVSLRLAAASADGVLPIMRSAACLSLPISFLLAAIAGLVAMLIAHTSEWPGAVFGLVFASQGHEMLRTVSLARIQHRRALVADSIRHGSALSAALYLAWQGRLSIATALGCLIVGALIGTVWQAWRLRVWLGRADDIGDLARYSWRLGKWDVLGGGVSNIAAQIMPWTLAAWHGSLAAAQLQAVANLLGATHPVLFGLSNIVTPAVAQAAASQRAGAKQAALPYVLVGFLLLLPYFTLLLAFPGQTLAFVYGKTSQYNGISAALRMFVVVYIGLYVLHMGQALLNGLGRSREVSVIGLIGLLLQAVIVMPLAIRFGLTAACAGAVAAQLIQCLTALRSVRRADGKLAQLQPAPYFSGAAQQILPRGAAAQIVPSSAVRD